MRDAILSTELLKFCANKPCSVVTDDNIRDAVSAE